MRIDERDKEGERKRRSEENTYLWTRNFRTCPISFLSGFCSVNTRVMSEKFVDSGWGPGPVGTSSRSDAMSSCSDLVEPMNAGIAVVSVSGFPNIYKKDKKVSVKLWEWNKTTRIKRWGYLDFNGKNKSIVGDILGYCFLVDKVVDGPGLEQEKQKNISQKNIVGMEWDNNKKERNLPYGHPRHLWTAKRKEISPSWYQCVQHAPVRWLLFCCDPTDWPTVLHSSPSEHQKLYSIAPKRRNLLSVRYLHVGRNWAAIGIRLEESTQGIAPVFQQHFQEANNRIQQILYRNKNHTKDDKNKLSKREVSVREQNSMSTRILPYLAKACRGIWLPPRRRVGVGMFSSLFLSQ